MVGGTYSDKDWHNAFFVSSFPGSRDSETIQEGSGVVHQFRGGLGLCKIGAKDRGVLNDPVSVTFGRGTSA